MTKKNYFQFNHLINKDISVFKTYMSRLIEKNKDNHRCKYYEILTWLCDCDEELECITTECLYQGKGVDDCDGNKEIRVNPLFETLEGIEKSKDYNPEDLGALNYFVIRFGDLCNRKPKGFNGHLYLDEAKIELIKQTCPSHFVQYVGKNKFGFWRAGTAGSNDFKVLKQTKNSITLKIFDKVGVHARPAHKIIGCFQDLKVNATAINKNKEVNAKSFMGLFSLQALCGEELTIKVTGRDAAEAIERLKEIRI